MTFFTTAADAASRIVAEDLLKWMDADQSAAGGAITMAIRETSIADIRAFISGLEARLRRMLGDDISLIVVTDISAGAVRADPVQVEQILLHLVANARDAMPGGGWLTIEVADAKQDESETRDGRNDRADSYVSIAVTDTGPGMDQATKALLFNTSRPPELTTGPNARLAIAIQMVRQLGGEIAADSEVGSGTTIRLFLPRPAPASSRSDAATPPLPVGCKTVLLVDDDDEFRTRARQVLQDCGYSVLEAGDGMEAIHMAETHAGRIDLLATESRLPNRGGSEVARRVAWLHPEVRALLLFGESDDEAVPPGPPDERVVFLPKPFDPDSFATTVRHLFEDRADRQATHSGNGS